MSEAGRSTPSVRLQSNAMSDMFSSPSQLRSPPRPGGSASFSSPTEFTPVDTSSADFQIPMPDLTAVQAPELRSLYADLLDRYKKVCTDKSSLFNEMRRRQEAALRKESEYRMKVTTLEERVDRSNADPLVTEKRMTEVRGMHDKLMQQITQMQSKTVSVLKEQEKDLLRAFRARLGELTNELKKERMKGEAGAQEWIDQCNKQARELTQARESSDAMTSENAALLKEQARLTQLLKTQEDDRQFLVKQLVTIKKENARLRLALTAGGTADMPAGSIAMGLGDQLADVDAAAASFASLALVASSDPQTPMHSSLLFPASPARTARPPSATRPPSAGGRTALTSPMRLSLAPQPSAHGMLTSPSARTALAVNSSRRPGSALPPSRPLSAATLMSPKPQERPSSATSHVGDVEVDVNIEGHLNAEKEQRYIEVIKRLQKNLEQEQKKARTAKNQYSSFLNDRSEIEGFLRSSIDQVKQEVATRMTQRLKSSNPARGVDAVNASLIGLQDFESGDRERFIQLLLANPNVLDALSERAFPRERAEAI